MPVTFDPEAIRALAAILTDAGLTEIEIEASGARIRVARTPAPVTMHAHAGAVPGAAPAVATATPTAAPSGDILMEDASRHPGAVLSPMVGVAYLSAEPGAAPFVSAGQTVSAGDTLLLIEAMKTFNQVKAPKAGVVTRILVASGAPVEYGEPLMVVE